MIFNKSIIVIVEDKLPSDSIVYNQATEFVDNAPAQIDEILSKPPRLMRSKDARKLPYGKFLQNVPGSNIMAELQHTIKPLFDTKIPRIFTAAKACHPRYDSVDAFKYPLKYTKLTGTFIDKVENPGTKDEEKVREWEQTVDPHPKYWYYNFNNASLDLDPMEAINYTGSFVPLVEPGSRKQPPENNFDYMKERQRCIDQPADCRFPSLEDFISSLSGGGATEEYLFLTSTYDDDPYLFSTARNAALLTMDPPKVKPQPSDPPPRYRYRHVFVMGTSFETEYNLYQRVTRINTNEFLWKAIAYDYARASQEGNSVNDMYRTMLELKYYRTKYGEIKDLAAVAQQMINQEAPEQLIDFNNEDPETTRLINDEFKDSKYAMIWSNLAKFQQWVQDQNYENLPPDVLAKFQQWVQYQKY
jgi:hypothetical protein